MLHVSRPVVVALALILLTAAASLAQGPGTFSTPTGEPFWTDMYRQERQRSREDAIAKYNYCPTSGCVVRLESIDLKPRQARRGETISLSTSYTLLTSSDIAIPVKFSREIIYRGAPLGKVMTGSTRNYNGTWSDETSFTLPENAAPGDYTLRTKITTGYGSDEKTVNFRVY